MARTVDPVRHEARRLAIIDAALTCFARDGYDRATTAAICAQARIGSGTFFHYFPTKLEVLLAILAHGATETSEWFAAQHGRTDALVVIEDYVAHSAAEMSDPRMGGFVRSVGSVMTLPEVEAFLERDAAVVRDGLLPWVEQAIAAGALRADLSPTRVVAWVQAVLDGYLAVIVAGDGADLALEQATLRDAVHRILRP